MLAVSLLEVLCEEIHHETENNVQIINAHINIIALHKTMVYCYQMRQQNEIAELAAIKTHNLLKHMEDFKDISVVPSKHKPGDARFEDKNNQKAWNCCPEWWRSRELFYRKLEDPRSEEIDSFYYKDKNKDFHQKAWNYCLERSRSIELFYRNEKNDEILAKVYFRLHPEDKLTKKQEDVIKHQVNCGTPKCRLAHFLLGMKSIGKRLKHLNRLKKHRWFPKILVVHYDCLNYLLTFWTIVMNVLLIVAWESVDPKFGYIYNPPEDGANSDLMLKSYCVEATCYNNSVNNSMFTQSDCDHSLCELSEILTPTVPDVTDHKHWFFNIVLYIGGIIHLVLSIVMVTSFFIMNGPEFRPPDLKIFSNFFWYNVLKRDKPLDHFKKRKRPGYFEIPFHVALLRSVYVLGFLTCSILSLVYYGYFYCICLLHIVVENTILQRVLKAISRNLRKLFWLVVLGLAVVYLYSVAAFAFFANEFHNPDSSNAQYCRSLFQCYITMFRYILIIRSVDPPSSFKDFALRAIIFDLTFHFVLIVIGINIFLAIVVDTFIELREEWWQIERDHKQICFICQKFSSEFEKKAKGFDHHIVNDHYMFNYVYFKLHIDKVEEDKRNAIESYVHKKIKMKRTDFFPLNAAKCLNLTPTEKKLNEIKEIVSENTNQISKITRKNCRYRVTK